VYVVVDRACLIRITPFKFAKVTEVFISYYIIPVL